MLNLKDKKPDVQLLFGALISSGFFVMLGLLKIFKIDTILDGSLGNLIAIPFLFLSIAVLVGACFLLFVRKDGRATYCYSALAIAVGGLCFYFLVD